ncbi:MAG: sigma factor [Solirubrobacteraceae bacterium]|jgi:RNA polymerase sigma-70 factor (ECF subfamily)
MRHESAIDDRDLLLQARDGSAAAFEVVYRRRYPLVLSFVTKRVREREQAADLLAETFAALLELVRNQRRPIPVIPIAWLLLTARYLIITSYRKGQVEAAARARLAMQPMTIEDGDLQRIDEVAAETDLLRQLEELLPADQLEALRAHPGRPRLPLDRQRAALLGGGRAAARQPGAADVA